MTGQSPLAPGSEIALFGTSADPPTLGHQALLRGLLRRFPRVATWASDNPMKVHGAALGDRAALLAALVAALDDPRLEHAQELSSPWAITTLERAGRRWPQAGLVFVVGSDLVPQIPRWKAAGDLLQRCRLAIVPRHGWPLAPASLEELTGLGGRFEQLPLAIPATASSNVRHQPRRDQVPAAVWPVLLKHNLYGLAADR
jgi:nicotinate-nucleotide adenylyltransferase